MLLFTDFGTSGPYVGQMKVALLQACPRAPVVDLMADAPNFDPKSAAYLLGALLPHTPENAVILAVIDPGVGGARQPMVARSGHRWLVGPDNGLLAPALRRQGRGECWSIQWRPPVLSASFHGRDLFAPVAGLLAAGQTPNQIGCDPLAGWMGSDWPDDWPYVIYIDHYGNVITGLRGDHVEKAARLRIKGREIVGARTFSEVPVGELFWYVNSIGLVEFSINQGHAGQSLSVKIGDKVD